MDGWTLLRRAKFPQYGETFNPPPIRVTATNNL